MRQLVITQVCLALVTLSMIISIICVTKTLLALDRTVTTLWEIVKDLQMRKDLH